MASFGGKIISGTVWSAAETWGRQAAVLAIFIVLARHLGPQALGLATLALVVPAILSVFVSKGIPDALVQRPEIEPIHLDSAFWLLVGAGAGLSALTWALAGAIAMAFSQPELESLVRWAGIIVLLQSAAAVPAAILRRRLDFRMFAIRTFIGTALGGAVGIGMAVTGFGAASLVAMQIARAVVDIVVFLAGSLWRPTLRYSHAHCRHLFGFAGPMIGLSLWTYVNEELPKVVIGSILGPYAVGLYAVARKPLDLISEIFLGPLVTVVMPTISRIQAEPEKIARFFDTTARMAAIAGFPAFIGFAAIAPEVIPFVFGDQWGSGVLAVQILMILGLQRTIDGLCGSTLLALGHSGLLLKFSMAYTVLGVLLLPLAARINIEATMVALLVCNLALLPVFLVCVQRIARIDVWKPLAIFPRVAAAAVLMFLAVTAWRSLALGHMAQPVYIVSAIGMGALVYGAVALVLVRPELFRAYDMLVRSRG